MVSWRNWSRNTLAMQHRQKLCKQSRVFMSVGRRSLQRPQLNNMFVASVRTITELLRMLLLFVGVNSYCFEDKGTTEATKTTALFSVVVKSIVRILKLFFVLFLCFTITSKQERNFKNFWVGAGWIYFCLVWLSLFLSLCCLLWEAKTKKK